MSIKKSLVFLLISFVLHCETRVLFKREKNTSETNSTNEIFEHVTSSAVLKSEHSDFKNEVSEEIVDGKDRLKKLWNEIDMLHRRNRRGFFNSHSRYKPKGPIYIDSDEYEFSPPLGEHSENKQTYFYPPPESHEDESKEEKESVEEIHEGPYPPSSHDRPYPSLTYGPPESAASHEETHPHPLHEDLHPPSSGDESHPPPSHDHPHEGYVIYPPEKDGPEDSKVEPHYEPYPPHSDLVPPKESTKDSGHDLKTDLKPNHELLIIAEKHISKIKEMEKKQEHEGPPSTSYGEPYSSIKEMEKKHEHEGPPSTSYGEPYSSISDPSPHIEPPKPVATVKGPPATSYGVPDAKIEVSEIKFSKENVSLVSSKKIKDLNEAKPYDLSSSSYGAPLKSVTNDIKTESTKNKPFFALPDVTKDSKFNLRNKKEINTDTNKFKKERAYVMIPMEKYQELEVCMQKSFSSAYTIKLDGSLVRE